MKKYLILALIFFGTLTGYSQINNPVKWEFSSNKIDSNTYEIHLTATIGKGWHTYSQTTPKGGPVPTSISFVKNPLVTLVGSAKEIGKMEQHNEPLFGVDVKQFSNKLELVQIVKVKGKVKTSISGTITFMACNDSQCLPPSDEKFSIQLK